MYISVLASANRQCWAQLTAATDEYFTASGVDRSLSAKYWVLQARQHPTILTKQQKTPKMTILINLELHAKSAALIYIGVACELMGSK